MAKESKLVGWGSVVGTSSRHPGSNDRSPLVPPHADAEPDQPLPDPPPRRFQQFRKNLGDFAKTGNGEALKKSLQRYASTATGGPTIGPRRFGTAISTGGAMLSSLAALGSGGDIAESLEGSIYEDETVKRIADSIGRPIDEAVQILSDAFAPPGEDSDKIREALVCALSETLVGKGESFDASILSEEIYTESIIHFLAEIIFIDIYNESGEAFEKIESIEILESRERELRALIKASVDIHLSSQLGRGVVGLSHAQLKDIQLSALKAVFLEWDGIE